MHRSLNFDTLEGAQRTAFTYDCIASRVHLGPWAGLAAFRFPGTPHKRFFAEITIYHTTPDAPSNHVACDVYIHIYMLKLGVLCCPYTVASINRYPRRGAMNDVFDSMERDFMMTPSWGTAFRFPHVHPMLPSINPAASGVQDGRFGMHLDFHETENGFELTADLPGVRKDDITVDVDRESGVLTVSGERKSNREEKSEGGGDGEGGDRK